MGISEVNVGCFCFCWGEQAILNKQQNHGEQFHAETKISTCPSHIVNHQNSHRQQSDFKKLSWKIISPATLDFAERYVTPKGWTKSTYVFESTFWRLAIYFHIFSPFCVYRYFSCTNFTVGIDKNPVVYTLPKTNRALKSSHPKREVIFQLLFFKSYPSFRECKCTL